MLGCFKQKIFLDRLAIGICATGITILLGYIYYRHRPLSHDHLLLSLDSLINDHKNPLVCKIALTQCSQSDGHYRNIAIQGIRLLCQMNNITVLVNCSPQKLFRAGCNCFLSSMDSDDIQYMQYYQQALKIQLLIQYTIKNIELINHNKNNLILMLCDNNSMDVKLTTNDYKIWNSFLSKKNITQEQLKSNYDMVLHLQSHPINQQDEIIEHLWDNFENYHKFVYQSELSTQDNLKPIIQNIIFFLSKYLPQQYQWKIDQNL